MLKSVATYLKHIVSFLPDLKGDDVKMKFYKEPDVKPPRRNPAVQNKTNSPEYMQQYMKDYRENGKDYQKMPDKAKQYRRQLRKRLRDQLKKKRPLQAALIDQELGYWSKQGQVIDLKEFDFICFRRGFSNEEQNVLAEELSDLNLIII